MNISTTHLVALCTERFIIFGEKLSFQLLSDATEPPVGFTNPLASSVTGSDTGSLPAEPPAYQNEVPGEGSNYQKF